jgi:hypothetical protein
MTKENYRANREAGHRGQGDHPVVIVGYTPANRVVQGAYGSRKARRAIEVHLNALNRRRQRAAK